jgi:hypothetical protein
MVAAGMKLRRHLAVVAVASFVLVSLTHTTVQASPPGSQVVCLTEWGYHPTGWYRTRPHSCGLHERGKFPAAHVNVYTAARLHWLHWGARSATARGKLGISTYGLAPLKLRLSRPRHLCGHTVFTRAHLTIRTHYHEHSHRSSFDIWLDSCLR